jgi:DNA (cytosine-5)-methyltransferase 1
MPQRRRRVFILAHKRGTEQHRILSRKKVNAVKWLTEEGTIARAFPVHPTPDAQVEECQLKGAGEDVRDVSAKFNRRGLPGNRGPFENSGIMSKGRYWTLKTKPDYSGPFINLGDVLITPGRVPDEFILSAGGLSQTKGWTYLKGPKREKRKGSNGFEYSYNEGGMVFPDALDKPSRTIITGEGGSGPSRFKHVVRFKPTKGQRERLNLSTQKCNSIRKNLSLTKTEWLRRLTPIELERLNQFPDHHTAGASDGKRAFFMGNALVIGIIQRLGSFLS